MWLYSCDLTYFPVRPTLFMSRLTEIQSNYHFSVGRPIFCVRLVAHQMDAHADRMKLFFASLVVSWTRRFFFGRARILLRYKFSYGFNDAIKFCHRQFMGKIDFFPVPSKPLRATGMLINISVTFVSRPNGISFDRHQWNFICWMKQCEARTSRTFNWKVNGT